MRAQQAAQTREAVLRAAVELFSADGWAATGIRDVARRAGVSVETVYGRHGSKLGLLLAAVDVGVVDDTEPQALAERPAVAALGVGTRRDRAGAAARVSSSINGRMAGLSRALRQAAAVDAAAAERLRELEERRRSDVATGLGRLLGAPATDEARDAVWALTSAEVYDLLVTSSGWSVAGYERWLTAEILHAVGEAPARDERSM
nr:helix-turn-helix domain-containing protein [Nocardioides panaciterrulae]